MRERKRERRETENESGRSPGSDLAQGQSAMEPVCSLSTFFLPFPKLPGKYKRLRLENVLSRSVRALKNRVGPINTSPWTCGFSSYTMFALLFDL